MRASEKLRVTESQEKVKFKGGPVDDYKGRRIVFT
jgi:hypothetical protein